MRHQTDDISKMKKLLQRLQWRRKPEAPAQPLKMVDMALLGRKEVMRGGIWFSLEFASYISTDKPASLGFHFGYGIKVYVPKSELPVKFVAQFT